MTPRQQHHTALIAAYIALGAFALAIIAIGG